MARQQLFYDSVIPLTVKKHKDLSIERVNYEFTREVNSVPLTAVEIPRASREFTIVFAGSDEIVPVVVLGIEDKQNIYLTDDGKWSANYVPAFVRRYPFVFWQGEDKTKYTLCVDEKWEGCNTEGRGDRLFQDDEERSPYLTKMLGFLEEYQLQHQRTRAYCQRLKELEILEPMRVDFTLGGGEKRSLGGFMAVSRAKLKELPAEKLAELVKTDELELTYAHLTSMDNFSNMLAKSLQAKGDAPAEGSAEASPAEASPAEESAE
ncbi:MAG: SapC family protein [Planctomycetaceae bacterium]|nr:SapC family protein [Planctomycetaceae bacterium]